ncbi:MAG: sulfatase-like hydrolase/transferase, partial [Planctomycetota bacterium]
MRVSLPSTLIVSVIVAGGRAPAVEAESRPNVVLIMADDLGVEGIGSYGGRSYATPAVDRLAADGARFTNAFAQPLCTNTRVQLMTGLYNNRNWLYFGTLDPEAKTIGHYMREAGYETCMAGKWQLQSYDPPNYPGADLRRGRGMSVADAGFDEYSVFHAWHTEDKGSRYARPTLYENGELLGPLDGAYGPDHWVDFINDFVTRRRDGHRPFFVYYAMALPHTPFVPTPDSEAWNPDRPDTPDDTGHFPDMVEYMDKCVGRVVDHIDALGLGDDTLIIFYSDNGTHQLITSDTTHGPVVGGKGKTTDAGTHVPLVVRWSGQVAPTVVDDLVDSTDFLPAVLDAADRPVGNEVGLDGVSFLPAALGDSGDKREWVFCHYDPRPGWDKDQFRKVRFARDETYKLYGDGGFYDVPSDPLEKRPLDVSAADP